MVLESNTLDVLFVKDGQQGEDGKVLYTWIKYAKDANGTGITDDPNGAVYIGISYNNESSIESNDPTHYAWTKIQGADGKKGEDAYTIFLENENISFATDKNRNPLSEQAYTSGITIMKGAKPVTDFTIGDIAKTQGIAVAKTDTAIAISVVNGNPLPNDSGEIEIPVTVGGTVFKKILTWTCAKKGEQGEKGEQGIQGPQGEQGIAGKDGTSVTITNKSITYQLSTSGTTIPTGTWQTTPQAIPEGQYQWTKTFVTYSDGNKTESYSISYHGKNGSDGTSVKTTSTSVKYQVGDSGTTKPTGTWQSNVPTVAQGKYLWTQTIVNYSDGNSTESYSVSYRGIDGSNGVNGMNVATIYLYQRATSTPGKPSNTLTYTFSTTKITGTLNNGWSTAIPTGTDAVYVTVASVSSKNDTATIATSAWSAPVVLAQNGKTGSDGKAGLNVATIYLYQRNTSKPSKPSASVTYTFSTGVASGLNNGWSQKIPDGTNPLYVTLATASSNTATDTILSSEWSDVVVMAQNGSDGQDGAGFHWNLLKYSGDLSKQVLGGAGTYTATVESIEDKTTPSGQAEKITYTVQGTGGKFIQTGKYIKEGSIKQGKTYTVSVWCKCSSIKSTGVINAEFLDNKTYVNPTLSTEWQQYVVTGVANKDVTSTSSASAISFYYSDNMSVGDIFYISSPKVEEGDKASPWCTTYEETLAKNLTITPSSQYFKSTDGGKTFAPNAITIKATIQGEINFGKWQYSIDGGVSFADAVSGQKGLTISNNVLTVSKDSSLYSDAVTMVTFRAVASDSGFYDTCSIAKIYDVSDIGDGRNLLWNSNFAKTDEAITGTTNSWGLHTRGTNLVASIDTSTKHNGFNTLKTVSAANGDKNSSNDLEWFAWGISERTSDNLHSKNQNYTLSFYAKASVTTDFIVRWGYDAYGADTTRTLTTNWQKYEIKLHQATSAYSITIIFKLLTAGTVWFSEFKLEKGSSATGYSTAPEDLQTAILSTKSEISDVSLKVDNNKQAIEQRVEKTTYEQDLKLVKGDISKANDGLNKWRYEIYPKSLFDSEDQSKSTIDIFARNLNLVPSQTVLLDDASLSTGMNYRDGYIAYALTFVKMSAKKDVTTKMFNDDGASLYVNGGLVITRPSEYTNGEEITFALAQGWNCIEVVVNEGNGTEGFRFSTTLSKLSECQMMNCYYGTPVARQSRITNQLVDVTKNLTGVTSTVQDVMTAVGNSGNITEFKNNYSKWKQNVDKIESRVGEKYVTNEKFDGLEIGGRNLLTKDDCNMSKWQNLYPAHCKITSNDYLNHVDYVPTGGEWEIIYKKISVTKGQKYILSFDYKVNKAYNYLSGQKYGVYLSTSVPTNATPANIITNGQYVIENTVTNIKRGMITFTAAVDTLYIVINGGCIDDNQTGLSFEFNKWKIEKGNKATDWTPAPEDNEINGQNLVSNLPSNWEQGTVTEGSTTGTTYANTKSSSAGSIRPKELIPVSGNITISIAYSNQSKKPIRHWIAAYDVNKNYLGNNYVSNAWNSFPRTLNMKDAKYIAIMVGYTDSSAITPTDISQICLKIERGTSATPFTLAPEDVNGKIVNVETIANQTAKKFEWIVKGESTSSNLVLTDNALTAIANNINLTGKVTFNSFDQSLKDTINNKTNVSYLNFGSGGNKQGFFKIATLQVKLNYVDQNIIFGVNHREHGYTECRIKFSNVGNTDPGMGSFKQTGTPTRAWRIIKTATSTWDLYLAKTDSWDGGRVIKFDNPYGDGVLVTWSGASADLPDDAIIAEQMIADQTTIDGGIITTGYLSADRIAASSITADKIATDAIKSRNYISSGGTQGSFLNLSNGSFTSPNLSWDSNGNLIATNANLSGQITATKGTVGGWNIDNYSIYTTYDANQNIFGAGISGTKGKYVLWAGETNDAIGANRSSNVPTDASLVIYNNGGLEVRKSMVGNDKKNHLYTTILQSGQINLKMDDDYIGTITATDTISSNSTVTMRHVSMAAKNGYGWSILHTNESGSLISDMQRDPGDTKIKINSPITVFSTDITKYNAIETTGDVVVSGKIHANYGSNKIQLNPDNNGSIELYGYTPFIDFHYGNSDSDYTSRIIAQEWGLQIVGTATVTGDLYCDAHIYTCTNGHFSWAGQTDAYLGCGNYSGGNNIYYYANYHAFYVNNDSGSGMMYINTNGVTSRVGFTKTSDERIKKNFESFDDNIIDAYMNIEPVKYQLKQSSNDNYHFGFKAQHVDKVFSDYGDTYNESFDICTSRPIDPDKAKELYGVDGMTEEYGLRYDELIAPTTYMVQHTYKELESTKDELSKVKQEKENLESRLQAIEAKLGL